MPEEDAGAGEMQQAEEVVDVPFPASHKPPEVVEPGKKPFDLPAATRTTDTPSILCETLEQQFQAAGPLPQLEASMTGLVRRIPARQIVPRGAGP